MGQEEWNEQGKAVGRKPGAPEAGPRPHGRYP